YANAEGELVHHNKQEFRCGYFFFSSRRRHTRLQGDWSSDVCSSDLAAQRLAVVVCTGNPAQDESHFGAQDLMEYGTTQLDGVTRSEERRVGKECRCRGTREH